MSRLTLSEHPNSLFKATGEAAGHLQEFHSSAVINNDSSKTPFRQNRSSSSGFLKAEPMSSAVRRPLTMDHEASRDRQSSSAVVDQLFDVVPSDSVLQQKSSENSSPPVRSWAAVLATGKNTQQLASESVVTRSQSNQMKASKSLSDKNTSVNYRVNQSDTNKSKSRSATRNCDGTQFSSADVASNRTKSSDMMSGKHSESQPPEWITVSSHDRKTKSYQPRDVDVAVKSMQDSEQGEHNVASNSKSKDAKQKKKKNKKKSKGPDIAAEDTSSLPVERTEVSPRAPEFHNLNEFPSLFSVKSGPKKTPLQTSGAHCTVSVPFFTSGMLV